MKTSTMIAPMVLAVLLAGVFAYAQEPLRPRVVAPNPTEERIAALEQRVATLEQQNAELRKVVVVAGNAVAIRAPDNGNLSLEAKTGNIKVEAQAGNMTLAAKMGDITLEAQLGKVTAKALNTVALDSAMGLRVRAGGELSLAGSRVLVNGGRRQVARTGDPAPGGIIGPGSPTFLTD